MRQIFLYTLFLLLILGCEEKVLGPIASKPGDPGVVTVNKVTNIAGGAKIEYNIPAGNELLYIKAIHTINNGATLEVKASLYEKSLIVKGYNDSDISKEYNVTLICVDRSNNEGSPVTVKIKPELSPLLKVANSIDIAEAFGGARYTWENVENQPITFFFMADTITTEGVEPGELIDTRIINTTQTEGEYISRGFPDNPREFAVILQDNFGNKTEQIKPEMMLTPLREERLDKSLMRVFAYGDTPVEDKWDYWEGSPDKIIDDNLSHTSCVISYQSPYPRHLTIDLGKQYKLSRYVWHQRDNGGSWIYAYGNPKTWYVYARATAPVLSEEVVEDNDGDGLPDWTNHWVRIDDYEIVKPSGLPGTQYSQEDLDAAHDGHNFDYPIELEEMRYIRYGITSNFDGAGWCNWVEIDFYGVEL